MSAIKPGPMPSKPTPHPKRGSAEWFTLKRKQARERSERKSSKGTNGFRFQAHVERATKPRIVAYYLATPKQAMQKMREIGSAPIRKPRKRLPRQSASMKAKWPEYERAKQEWREERIAIDGYLRCEFVSPESGFRCRRHAMKSPHHKAGRAGKNLADKSKFMADCAEHHRWIDDHRKQSETLGYIIRERQKH